MDVRFFAAWIWVESIKMMMPMTDKKLTPAKTLKIPA